VLIPADDPRATAAKAAIEGGDVAALTALLGEHPAQRNGFDEVAAWAGSLGGRPGG